MPDRLTANRMRWSRSALGARRWQAAVALLVGLLAGSCQRLPSLPPPAAPAGAPMAARPRWWNYYRRGIEYSLAGNWAAAVPDLETALGRRRGALFGEAMERRRAKTYGLHHLDDYFPHRELGICLYHLGQFDAAEKELAASLAMLPSSRASFYLNEVRRTRLRQSGAAVSPQIRIDQPLPDGPYITNRLQLELRGLLSGPGLISRVTINRQPLFIELAQPEFRLAETVRVLPGEQDLVIEAEDLLGGHATWRRAVVVDLEGPALAIRRPPGGRAGEVALTVSDDRELAMVQINGQRVPLASGQASVSIPLSLRGLTQVEVAAIDRAGNRTEFRSTPSELPQAARSRPAGARLLAGLPGPVLLAAADPAVAQDAAAVADTLRPVLRLYPAVSGRIAVTTDIYLLDVQIEDGGGVAAITFTLNGHQETREFQPSDATVRRLTRSLQLQPGPNELSISVRDRAGNTDDRAVTIVRRLDEAWREDLRVTGQVVLPPCSGPSTGLEMRLYPQLLAALTEPPARLNIVERDPAVLQRLVQEHMLSDSPVSDLRTAIRKGRMQSANWALVGRITVWSGKDNYELVLQIVDVPSSEVVLTTDIHFAEAGREHTRLQLRGLVAKLEQRLPRLTTRVASRSGKGLVLPVGGQDQVLPGLYVLFLPTVAERPDYADPLTWQGTWVHGRVKAAHKASCQVSIDPAEASASITGQERVVFR